MDVSDTQKPMSPSAERLLSYIVLGGATLSVILFVIGIILAMIGSPVTQAEQPMPLDAIMSSIASMDAMGVIGIGVIVVISTPLVRIFATILYFSGADRRFVAFPIITFVLIIVSFVLRM